MKTFISLALDTRRAKADGTYPILLRIIHHEKPSSITIGIYVKENDWDKKARCIKPSFKGTESVTRLNNFLQKKKSEAIDIVTKLDERKVLDTYTVLQIKELIEKKPSAQSFFAYARKQIEALQEAKRLGTARAYKSAIDAFETFNNKRDLSFHELNLSFLTKFEIAHLKKGKSYNGLSSYLRAIRAIFNRAIKEGIVEQELYPFANYEIKSSKTRKRAISREAISKIETCILQPNDPLYHARNYFLASFYMRGISFTDLAELKLSDITDNRLHYERKKTGTVYDMAIPKSLQKILALYTPGKEAGDYVFPIVHRKTEEEIYVEIQDARKRFNKKLKLLAVKCGIQEKLTSYVSRHSFATIAKNLGFDVAAISDMLGHESISTTQIYLDGLSSSKLDEMTEKILQ